MWCIPCGYVEYSEDVRESLVREMKEETGLDVTLGRVFEVYSNFHNPNQHTVGLWFLTEEVKGEAVAMDDLDEVGYFTFEEIASNGLVLAFPTDKRVIEALKIQNMID
jgi:ADP-ribose pyrophosphatase YjhB (NUDIX family)